MTPTSQRLAAIALAAGIGLGSPLAANAADHGTHGHHHDSNRFLRHDHHHHHHHDNHNDGVVNSCDLHPRLWDRGTDSYAGTDGERHYCENPISE